MNEVNTRKVLGWLFRIVLLLVLYLPIWISGALLISHLDPNMPSEPGLVNTETGFLLLSIINTLVIVALVLSSNLRGLRLAVSLGIAYYGVYTFLTQVETWYFLGEINVSNELLLELFLMGLPVPILFIPLAIIICGRWKSQYNNSSNYSFPFPIKGSLFVKILFLAVVYVIIYWLAGYFIAWQNPELREFYGSPGNIVPFWEHTMTTLKNDPGLLLLQLIRGALFSIFAYLVIYNSKATIGITALIVGFFMAAPHFGHIISNPLMPVASVRLSHMVETATSTFIFGVIVSLVLWRRKK